MSFDLAKFEQIVLTPREDSLPVPELRAFFPDDENPTWRVRGLTGPEYAKADQAADNYKTINQVAKALQGGVGEVLATTLKQVFGLSDETPEGVAKRLRMLSLGSVEPICTEEMSVKLYENFPKVFFRLTNLIEHLSGLGGEEASKKPLPSTETPV